MRVPVQDTDAVLADAMAEQADVRRLTGTHTHADERHQRHHPGPGVG